MNKKFLFSIAVASSLMMQSTFAQESIKYGSHAQGNDGTYSLDKAVKILLKKDEIVLKGKNALVEKTKLTIKEAGTYYISGELENGGIIIDTPKEALVKLVLDGVTINSEDSAAIFVKSAKKVVIVNAKNSKNYLKDDSDNDVLNAVIYSKENLSIYGEGQLFVEANAKDAIKSKDGLHVNANINIKAKDDGLTGKDYLVIKGGNINIDSKGDGLKSNNKEDAKKGYILIEDANITINSQNDSIQAKTNIKINSGNFNLKTTGGGTIFSNEKVSSKAIKAGQNIELNGGKFNIDSKDDSIHSNNNITINNGEYSIKTEDDGVHADEELVINNGKIIVKNSYEAIEANVITINGGDINVASSDDAINAAGGIEPTLYINGGNIFVNSAGDGIDVNGNIEMTNGLVLVNGPTESRNGALDYDRDFKISGGFLVASGSARMAHAAGPNSSQNSLLVGFKKEVDANTMVHIEDQNGKNILSFVPIKEYESLAFSSSELKKGNTYFVYLGGKDSGKEINGLFTSGKYSSGELFKEFTISDVVTSNIERRRGRGGKHGGRGYGRGNHKGEHGKRH